MLLFGSRSFSLEQHLVILAINTADAGEVSLLVRLLRQLVKTIGGTEQVFPVTQLLETTNRVVYVLGAGVDIVYHRGEGLLIHIRGHPAVDL